MWLRNRKEHLLIGRVFGVYLSELLIDAVSELSGAAQTNTNVTADNHAPAISLEYYNHLRLLEEADRQMFHHSIPPHSTDMSMAQNLGDGNLTAIFRGDVYCHTALLPSAARLQGLTTGSLKRGVHHFGGHYTGYDIGFPMTNIPHLRPNETEIDLVLMYDPGERQDSCPEGTLLETDYKDWFNIEGGDGRYSTILPNDAEMREYDITNDTTREGMIIVCTRVGGRNPYPGNIPLETALQGGNLEIRVDGQNAVNASYIKENCYILAQRNGSVLWGPGIAESGVNGRYKIEFKLNTRGSRLYLSSIIIL